MENSIARIRIPEYEEVGTCYFLSKKIVATCFHVIASVFQSADATIKPDSCKIDFYETYTNEEGEKRIRKCSETAEKLLGYDEVNDIAILELCGELSGANPVTILRHNTIPSSSAWESRGFPVINMNGIPLDGKIQALVTQDLNGDQRMELTADQVTDQPLGGISGSPVFVNGKVVGHITSNAIDDRGKCIFGLVYAVSGGYIRRLADTFVEGLGDDLGVVVFKDGEIYIKRGIEGLISDDLLKGGVCLTGYLMCGKTRTINYFKEFEKDGIFLGVDPTKICSALIDFYSLKTKIEEFTFDSLLKFFCDSIVREINTTGKSFSPPDWDDIGTKTFIASEWFTNTLLNYFMNEGMRFIIYIDNSEVLYEKFDRQIGDNFFSMLRSWTMEQESRGVFGIMLSFTDAYFLRNVSRPAIFNGASSPPLRDLNVGEIQVFARKYCLEYGLSDGILTSEQAEEIIKWTSGNPCLVRLLFTGIRAERVHAPTTFDFNTVLKRILRKREWFRYYLDPLETSLYEAGLTKELSLYNIEYSLPNIDKSDAEARRKLVKSGVLLEQMDDAGSKRYKLRCAHFSF